MQESHCSRDFRAPLAPSALSSPAIVVPPTSWTMPSLPGVHTPKHFEGQRSPHPLGPAGAPVTMSSLLQMCQQQRQL